MQPSAYTLTDQDGTALDSASDGNQIADVDYDTAARALADITGEPPESVAVRTYLLAADQLPDGIDVEVDRPGAPQVTLKLTAKEV